MFRSCLLACCVAFLSGCTTPDMLRHPVRVEGSSRPTSGATAVLSKFEFHYAGPERVGRSNLNTLRESVIRSIQLSGVFRETLDGKRIEGEPGEGAVYFDVAIVPSVERDFNWYLAWPGVYPLVGYWPLQPRKGVVKTVLQADLFRGSRFLKRLEIEVQQDFSVWIYGFFRTGPEEGAATRSYYQALRRLSEEIRNYFAETEGVPET